MRGHVPATDTGTYRGSRDVDVRTRHHTEDTAKRRASERARHGIPSWRLSRERESVPLK